jgi:hypothetical protein
MSPIGIFQANNITMANISNLVNVSNFPEFLVKNNTIIYGGVFWFIMMFIMFILLAMLLQKYNDQLLNNLMYSSAIISVLSFILRSICIGNVCLLTDHQLFIFPIITAILGLIVWATKSS